MYLISLLVLLIILIAGIIIYFDKNKYENSDYKKESGNSYFSVKFNKGNYGEYLTFNNLDKIKGKHKMLTNVYLPKGRGSTTEVDLIFIHETGIYVIESKNYSGWIFGSEDKKFWTQTFNNGRKERFYNPIWQNNTHMKYLIELLKTVDPKLFKSIIVFSERCVLKKLEVHSEDIKVVNRYKLNKAMTAYINKSKKVLGQKKINEIYLMLKPYTQASDKIKENHIQRINKFKK